MLLKYRLFGKQRLTKDTQTKEDNYLRKLHTAAFKHLWGLICVPSVFHSSLHPFEERFQSHLLRKTEKTAGKHSRVKRKWRDTKLLHSNLQLFTMVKFSIQCEPHERNRCLRHFSHELVPSVVYDAAVYNLDTSCKEILTLPWNIHVESAERSVCVYMAHHYDS